LDTRVLKPHCHAGQISLKARIFFETSPCRFRIRHRRTGKTCYEPLLRVWRRMSRGRFHCTDQKWKRRTKKASNFV